ncbi:hypothetical protein HK104_001727, partial [Borealophlyctis nickersoniae]
GEEFRIVHIQPPTTSIDTYGVNVTTHHYDLDHILPARKRTIFTTLTSLLGLSPPHESTKKQEDGTTHTTTSHIRETRVPTQTPSSFHSIITDEYGVSGAYVKWEIEVRHVEGGMVEVKSAAFVTGPADAVLGVVRGMPEVMRKRGEWMKSEVEAGKVV